MPKFKIQQLRGLFNGRLLDPSDRG